MNQYKGNYLSYHLQERKKKNLADSCEEYIINIQSLDWASAGFLQKIKLLLLDINVNSDHKYTSHVRGHLQTEFRTLNVKISFRGEGVYPHENVASPPASSYLEACSGAYHHYSQPPMAGNKIIQIV